MNDAFVGSFETQVLGRLFAFALTPHLGSGLACLTSVQRILLGHKAGHHAKSLVKILSTAREISEERDFAVSDLFLPETPLCDLLV